MTLDRRTFLRWTGAAGAATVLPAGALAGYLWSTADRSNLDTVRFGQPLRIPPLARTRRDDRGRVVVPLTLRSGRSRLLPGRTTATWGVNGDYLGPTIRVRRGDVLAPQVHNLLPETTTLHWHGAELPGRADGGPHQPIARDSRWSPAWRVDQPAATLWYHPHPHGHTKDHVYRGVAGLLLLEDGLADGLLPAEYGVDDVPVIVQDKAFTDDGELDLDGVSFGGTDIVGLLGSDILVNGTWGPVLAVETELVRLRVLNASNARVYDLVRDDGRPFHVIAGDSGLLPAPVPVEHVQLSPGERTELLVSVDAGERVRLRSRPPDLGGNRLYERLAGGDDVFELLELRAAQRLRPSPPLPGALPAPPPLPVPDPDRAERLLRLGDFRINDETMDMDRIDHVVELGSTETWRIRNDVDVPHNFHVHNATFEVLEMDGDPPTAALAGRKDTVYVRPRTEVRVRVRFGQHPGTRWPYMFHCHLLAHEDAGMMGQYVMIRPGEQIPTVAPTSGGGHRDHL
jgi:FtsP/CotA-like multicopper oxidase with cupredoxin domain